MKQSRRNRVRRPYARPSRRPQQDAPGAKNAGRHDIVLGGHNEIEPLEQRQMLFSLTFDNANGIGTIYSGAASVAGTGGDGVQDTDTINILDQGVGTLILGPGEDVLGFVTYVDVNDDGVIEIGVDRFTAVFEFGYVLPQLAPATEFDGDADEPFAEALEERIIAARFYFSGLVGSSIEVQSFDPTGGSDGTWFASGTSQTRLTRFLDQDPTDDTSDPLPYRVDGNLDGVPDFNLGIARITLSGNIDSSANLTIVGGDIELDTDDDDDSLIVVEYTALDGFDDFVDTIATTFGHFALDDDDDSTVDIYNGFGGLPQGNFSVIVGSPFDPGVGPEAPASNGVLRGPNDDLLATDYDNEFQGIRIVGGDFGNIQLHGLLYGQTIADESLGRLNVTALYGDVFVAGDLGELIVAADAGITPIPEAADFDGTFAQGFTYLLTGSEVSVTRSVGEIASGGRMISTITVFGDTSGPAGDVLVHNEREVIVAEPEITDALPDIGAATINATGLLVGGDSQAAFFGSDLFRNDTLLSSEIVNGLTGSVEIRGSLFGENELYSTQDLTDVYAFVVDGSTPITIQSPDGGGLLIRVLNEQGETVAAFNELDLVLAGGVRSITFDPGAPGVYYLAIGPGGGAGDIEPGEAGIDYSVFLSGIAPVALGGFRSSNGASAGAVRIGDPDDPDFGAAQNVSVFSGSAGAIRIGTGLIGADADASSEQVFLDQATGFVASDDPDDDDRSDMFVASISVTGNLYAVSVGGDIFQRQGIDNTITVSGDFGTLLTDAIGVADPDSDRAIADGTVAGLVIEAGGNIASIDVQGEVGEREDNRPGGLTLIAGANLTEGATIGLVRVAFEAGNGSLSIVTPDNSIIEAVLIAADAGAGAGDGIDAIFGPGGPDPINFDVGEGSDIRFVQVGGFPLVSTNQTFAFTEDQRTFTLVDDGGARFTITYTGDIINAGENLIRFLPVEGSEGGVIGEIVVNFAGGGDLIIESISGSLGDSIGIGRILVLDADADQESNIIIAGVAEIDILEIVQLSGDSINSIRQTSTNGDILAIDVQGVERLVITDGNLGSINTVAWGPTSYGPRLGLTGSLSGTAQSALGINAAAIGGNFNGQIYRPLDSADGLGQGLFADDVGFPFDGTLEGLVVRSDDVGLVSVSGSIRDVIHQGNDGRILQVVANNDGVTDPGAFDGIVGSIYAEGIGIVNVGDGLVANAASSVFAQAGIFAADDIVRVEATGPNADIRGIILAANTTLGTVVPGDSSTIGGVRTNIGDADGDGVIDVDGLGSVVITGAGDFFGATIGATVVDRFWDPLAFDIFGVDASDIGTISTNTGSFVLSRVLAGDLNLFRIGGVFDASTVNAVGSVNEFLVGSTQNSFLNTATTVEPPLNLLLVGQTLNSFATIGSVGDVADMTIDVVGRILEISARTFDRVNLDVDNDLVSFRAFEDVRSSTFIAGALLEFVVSDDIVGSTFRVSGLTNISVTDTILNSRFTISGPDGVLNLLQVGNDLDADIAVSGRVNRVQTTNGDFTGTLTTTTDRGSVGTLFVGGDLLAELDISSTVGTIEARGNVGTAADPNVLLINRDLTNFLVGGRHFGELRVQENILGTVRLGSRLPDGSFVGDGRIEAAGSIVNVRIEGSYGGDVISNTGGIFSVTINGSLLANGSLQAYDGDIGTVLISGGNLLGDIIADRTIFSITVESGDNDGDGNDFGGGIGLADGVGTVITDESIDTALGYLGNENDGRVLILAGLNIGLISTDGSMVETSIIAGGAIDRIEIGGTITRDAAGAQPTIAQGLDFVSNLIAAGDRINHVEAGGIFNTMIMSGLTGFGADGVLGGTDDTGRMGVIGTIQAPTLTQVAISAGVNAGADGIYNSSGQSIDIDGDMAADTDTDDMLYAGVSFVREIISGGDDPVNATGVSVFSDAFGGALGEEGTLEDLARTAPATDWIFRGSNGHLTAEGSFDGGIAPNNALGVLGFEGLASTIDGAGDIGGNTTVSGPTTFTSLSGDYTITTTGSNGLYAYDAINDIFYFALTDFGSTITVQSNSGTINGLTIVGIDDASIGLLDVRADLVDSLIIVDGFVQNMRTQDFSQTPLFAGTGGIIVGANILSLTTGNYSADYLSATDIRSLTVVGTFGSTLSGVQSAARDDNGDGDNLDAVDLVAGIDIVAAGSITITGDARARINVERSINVLAINGQADNALIRVGRSAGTITLGSANESRISINDTLTNFNVAGDFFDSALLLGLDLGVDANFDSASGLSNDTLTTGGLVSAVIGGDFRESDIVAGGDRGSDRFFGTEDDGAARGRGNIQSFVVNGIARGSNFNSESYLVSATGDVVSVRINGAAVSANTSIGNLDIRSLDLGSVAIEVTGIEVVEQSGAFFVFISFNQAMDTESLLSFDPMVNPLTITEVSDGDELTLGPDYVLAYDDTTNSLVIRINPAITEAGVPDDIVGSSVPGVYRFELSASRTRAVIERARLDGNADGAVGTGDDYSVDALIGDAGDRLNPLSLGGGFVDLFGPADLNELFDSNFDADSDPETETEFTISGFLGNHPDQSASFGAAQDIDLYTITLAEGQIIDISALSGAVGAVVTIFRDDGNGNVIALEDLRLIGGDLDSNNFGIVSDASFVVLEGGEFIIAISSNVEIYPEDTDDMLGVPDLAELTSPPTLMETPPSNALGSYSFTFSIREDGQQIVAVPPDADAFRVNVPTAQQIIDNGGTFNGFSLSMDQRVTDALQSADAGAVVGNADLLLSLQLDPDTVIAEGVIGLLTYQRLADGRTVIRDSGFLYTLSDTALNVFEAEGITDLSTVTGTLDDFLAARLPGSAVTVTGTNADTETSTRQVSGQTTTGFVAEIGSSALPGDIAPDFDIFTILDIEDGTSVRITVGLSEFGSDLGSFSPGFVQFAVFDTSSGSSELLLSPSAFQAFARNGAETIADDGQTTYGFDANGDFFIEFITPDDGFFSGDYQIYVQGVQNSLYTLDVTVGPEGAGAFTPITQNILLEFEGGIVDWLLPGGQELEVGSFDAAVNGLFGDDGSGFSFTETIISLLFDGAGGGQLEALFAGFNVVISTDPGDFEFQDFSTVFVTSTVDPLTASLLPAENPFTGLPSDGGPYGYNEGSDALNARQDDEAIVFTPSFNTFEFSADAAGAQAYADALTNAIARQVGQLLGLRVSEFGGGVMDVDSVSNATGSEVYENNLALLAFGSASAPDTNFFFGVQDAGSLLDLILAP